MTKPKKNSVHRKPEVKRRNGIIGIHTNKIHYMQKYLLNKLPRKAFAQDFMKPMGPEAQKLPTYNNVKKSMDVGSIIQRVQNRYYSCVNELVTDFKLVVDNYSAVYSPEDIVYQNCQKLDKYFAKILSLMPPEREEPSDEDPKTACETHTIQNVTPDTEQKVPEQQKKAKKTQMVNEVKTADAEHRAIYEQFNSLPLESKKNIIKIIAQTEDILTEISELQSTHIHNFCSKTLNRMKKAMHTENILNMRNMQKTDKESLQRILLARLNNIEKQLKA